ncbi:MAG: DNA replication protein DnaC, partial [Lachnospiraceae bacterium]|nr:DNA replication protein DnaC [Lachnospiraceae bacterium]
IDDLGTELTNTYTASELFRLIDERIQKKLATVISTNLSASEIKNRYSERISSRIGSSYQLLHLSGDDLRMRKVIEGNY